MTRDWDKNKQKGLMTR